MLEQVGHVLSVHCTCLVGHVRWKVGVADDGHTVRGRVDLVLLSELAVSTTDRSQIDNDTASLHASDSFLCDQKRGRAARDGSRGNDDIHLGSDLAESLLLGFLESIGALLGITTSTRTVFLEVYTDPLGTHGVNLVGDITHIPGPDNRAQGFGGSNGSETSDTTAEDKGLGRRILACSSHLRSVESTKMVRSLYHCTMARHFGLGGQNI
mmetsp:Transcript_43521/g.93215  ORF Transcript_43521/g.93215 Transcript_43521/m.93215 type:complete len:210 (-) Transcript_43521:520-1149(-)